jgi:hypothetical protein
MLEKACRRTTIADLARDRRDRRAAARTAASAGASAAGDDPARSLEDMS